MNYILTFSFETLQGNFRIHVRFPSEAVNVEEVIELLMIKFT